MRSWIVLACYDIDDGRLRESIVDLEALERLAVFRTGDVDELDGAALADLRNALAGSLPDDSRDVELLVVPLDDAYRIRASVSRQVIVDVDTVGRGQPA